MDKPASKMEKIGRKYDAERLEIICRINAGQCSASMSGIEYYPKPWKDMSAAERMAYAHIRK